MPAEKRSVRCHRWRIKAGEISGSRRVVETSKVAQHASKPVLQIDDLKVAYQLPRSLAEIATKRMPPRCSSGTRSELVADRRTIGIVGESGSGKSSLARAIIGLAQPQAGKVELLGVGLPAVVNQRNRETLAHLQMVFQNPDETLNPYLPVGKWLSRLNSYGPEPGERGLAELLQPVRLPAEYAQRLPGQLKRRRETARGRAQGRLLRNLNCYWLTSRFLLWMFRCKPPS